MRPIWLPRSIFLTRGDELNTLFRANIWGLNRVRFGFKTARAQMKTNSRKKLRLKDNRNDAGRNQITGKKWLAGGLGSNVSYFFRYPRARV